jgi:hypothetical protein
MGNDEDRDEIEQYDPLAGAEEKDGTSDGFRRVADRIDEGLGLTDADQEPVPDDDDAAGDAMP